MAFELSDDEIAFVDYASRIQGIRETVSGRIRLVSGGHNATASGRSAGRWLLSPSSDHPTAIVALSDVLALGVLEAAAELGMQVPRDVSVCGFDDIPAAQGGWPDNRTPAHSGARPQGWPIADRSGVSRPPDSAAD